MFIIHITNTHLFSFMKSFLILIASFGLAFNTYAAEKSLSREDMPQGFKSGDASAGSSLVESCVACHGTDGNSCLLYTSPSPRDGLLSRMPSSA